MARGGDFSTPLSYEKFNKFLQYQIKILDASPSDDSWFSHQSYLIQFIWEQVFMLAISTESFIELEEDLIITNFGVSLKYFSEEFLDTEDGYKEIGYINVYRFNLDYSIKDLVLFADYKGQHLIDFAEPFFDNIFDINSDELCFKNYVFYIENVFLAYEYRGIDVALMGLGLFLKNYAKYEIVAGVPTLSHGSDLRKKWQGKEKKAQNLLRKYWSKLGLEQHDSKHNILWTSSFELPMWLEQKLFN